MIDFSKFEQKNNVVFKDKDLLKQAFIHRSYINEHRHLNMKHNERLEFLGDAVLELVVTDYLFSKFPEKTEGDLTSFRSALVNATTLSNVADTLSMNDYLLLSRGERRDTGRARQYILADTLEALIGALYLDQGYAAAKNFIATHLFVLTDEMVEKRLWQDAKSYFQEKSQEIVGVTPLYKTLEEKGPDHNKHFIVGVFLGDEEVERGEGKSKQEAEQDAAKHALEKKKWK